ncbi:hypothetical protein SBRCBS47491_002258 [Sporothrix bragantina]|uniref:DUF2406 domain-containing protein n=1 Tax=Sporothrix bragantina TaxID=671064 RepID=A0ABP0B5I1_9PEZI
MMATYNNNNAHPLPSAPVGGASMLPPQPQPVQYAQHHQQSQQQQPQQYQQTPQQMSRRESQASRPKSRSFSFRSDRSHSQKGAVMASQKLEPETHAEKEAKRLHSKADPTMAMVEAEPSAVAATVKSSLAPLRSIVHKDNNGNPIAEPDKSNPTRYRWERPLDTIRSFEAAIDGGYTRKSSYPNENESTNFSRRSSYYTQNNNNARYPQDSYYGRPQSHMPTSTSAYDLRQSLHGRGDSYYDQGNFNNNGGYYNGNSYGNGNGPRQRYSRIQSEPQIHGHMGRPDQMNGQNNIYPIPNNHRSYETVASGAGSSGTSGEPAGYQTDPTSSDNSSIERRQSPSKPNMMGQGYQGYPGHQNGGYQQNGGYGGYNGGPKRASPPIQLSSAPMQQQQPPMNQMGQMQNGAPMAPIKNVISRKPTNSSQQPSQTLAAPAAADKRKSWFSKRFSRQN